jgi:hypothetical protein
MSEWLLKDVTRAEAARARMAIGELDVRTLVRACQGDARVALPIITALLTLVAWPDDLIEGRQREQARAKLAALYAAMGTERDG